jgi:hypothetical protein
MADHSERGGRKAPPRGSNEYAYWEAIAGTTVSPGLFESVAVLGRDQTLARMDRALEQGRAPCR